MKAGSFSLLVAGSAFLVSSCSRYIVRSEPVTSSPTTSPVYCLPQSLMKLRIEQTGGAADTATLEEVAEADRQQCYRLDIRHHVNAADDWTVTLDTKGLLSSVDLSTTDQTGEILQKLVELGKQVAKAVAAFPAARLAEGEKRVVEVHFDPCDPGAAELVNREVRAVNYSLAIQGPSCASNVQQPPFKGVAYRRTVPWQFRLSQIAEGAAGGGDGAVVYRTSFVFDLPNGAPTEILPFESGVFVTTKTTAKFSRGVLVELKASRPSEALQVINVPVEMAKTVASIPGELLTLRVEQTQSAKDLVEAQKALLEAKQLLEQTRSSQGSP